MPIAFKDFFPATLKSGFFSTEHEPLDATVVRANEWLAAVRVRVLNVETVVLPNLGGDHATTQSYIRTSGEMSSYWFQIVRVWFESPAA